MARRGPAAARIRDAAGRAAARAAARSDYPSSRPAPALRSKPGTRAASRREGSRSFRRVSLAAVAEDEPRRLAVELVRQMRQVAHQRAQVRRELADARIG